MSAISLPLDNVGGETCGASDESSDETYSVGSDSSGMVDHLPSWARLPRRPRRSVMHAPTARRRWILQSLSRGRKRAFMQWMDKRGRTGRLRRKSALSAVTRGEEERCEEPAAEACVLADEVRRRAGEMCMMMNLKSFTRRQEIRLLSRRSLEGSDGTASLTSSADLRMAVGLEANRFDESYAGAQEVLQDWLAFEPPVRSNSVAAGETSRAMDAMTELSSNVCDFVGPRRSWA